MKTKISKGCKPEFEINTSNRWAYIYRDYFGHDIMPDLVPMVDTVLSVLIAAFNNEDVDEDKIQDALYGIEYTTTLDVIWALAKNADDEIPEPPEWYDSFEKFEDAEVIPEVMQKLIGRMIGTKKLKLLQTKGAETISQFIRSSSQEQTEASRPEKR